MRMKTNGFALVLIAAALVGSGGARGQAPGMNGSDDLHRISTEASEQPVKIEPGDPAIRLIGRFDTSDKTGPRCCWSASTLEVRFSGTALNVKLNGHRSSAYEVEVDGRPSGVLAPMEGSHTYTVFQSPTQGSHVLRLVRRAEAFNGIDQFLGFELSSDGKLLPAAAPAKRRIEIVGDSITCGYGNEGKSKEEHFTPATENAYLTYGAIAARNLGAEYTCAAWSGRKMWPDNTMDEVYGRTLPVQEEPKWDFSHAVPDVVVINLSTNDWGKGAPDHDGWIAGYRKFIARVRKNYPKAAIYCAVSPMMGGDGLTQSKAYLNEIVAAEQADGYRNVRLIEFATQREEDGIGADWHPSVKTHRIMAKKLEDALRADLKWTTPVATAAGRQ